MTLGLRIVFRAAHALIVSHNRLATAGEGVKWLQGGICAVNLLEQTCNAWHERAVRVGWP